jgi:hypothetical protein
MGKAEHWPEKETTAWPRGSSSSFLALHIYICVSHPHPNQHFVPLSRPVLYHVRLVPISENNFSLFGLLIALMMEEISVYEASINTYWTAQCRRLPNLFSDFDSIFKLCHCLFKEY